MFGQKGLTIVEILIVISILGFLIAAVAPLYYSFSVSEQLNTETQELLQTLRRAQIRAISGEADLRFGVYFLSNQYILFAGNSYATRDSDFDEVYNLSPTLFLSWSLGGPSEVVFNKVKGTPSVVGTVTLTSVNNKTKTLSINQVGKIDFE